MAGLSKSQELALIEAASRGNRAAAGTLVQAHQAGVYAYILRLSGRGDVAEDVVQDALVRALTNLDRFDPRFRFSTWLFTIARRVYLNLIEKKRPSSNSERVSCEAGRGHARGEEAWGDEDEGDRRLWRDTIQRALMTLPLAQREVVVLFHQHDWPIWLIADHLGMPEGTVKSHLHRGRVKLREVLRHEPTLPGMSERLGAGVAREDRGA
jgi:RNA polymerase sigma-70 factor (ECF subfamily)